MRILATVVVLLVLAACGADPDERATGNPSDTGSSTEPATETTEPTSEPSVEPADGKQLDAAGVTFWVPRGWADVTEDHTGGLVLAAADLSGSDEVPDMLTLRNGGKEARDLTALESDATRSLESTGHRRIVAREPVAIDGTEASHLTAVMPQKGAPLTVHRYDASVGGTTWTVTYSAHQWKLKQDKERTIASILASWSWS